MATLNVRNIDAGAASRIRTAARRRNITLGVYLAQLMDLHDFARGRADSGDDAIHAALTALGLQTITG